MKTSEWIFLIVIFVITIFILIYTFIYFFKKSIKNLRVSTFFGFRSAKVKIKKLNSFVSHNFLVNPKREYEVVYRLETNEGKIRLTFNNQLTVETSTRVEGSEIITFGVFQPGVVFSGENAKDGEAYVKIYKRPKSR